MAAEPTAKSRFESRFGGGFIAVGQWLAELMVERLARSKNRSLPVHFWKTPEWEKPFKQQLRAAAALLRLYQPKAISAALRTTQGKRVISLSAPWLDDIIRSEQRKLDLAREAAKVEAEARAAEPAKPEIVPTPDMPLFSRPAFVRKKSTLSRLEGL